MQIRIVPDDGLLEYQPDGQVEPARELGGVHPLLALKLDFAQKKSPNTRGHQDAGATSTALILRTILHELDATAPEPLLAIKR